MGIGAMMAGGNPAEGRQEDDFYATPPEATMSILRSHGPFKSLYKGFYDPCCGDGAICKAVEAEVSGSFAWGSDLVDRGWGEVTDIFEVGGSNADVIITNPPFSIAEKIIRHVLGNWREIDCLVLLLKSTFFHADERTALFNEYRPTHVYMLPWRLDFLGKNRPTMECSWFVWDKNNPTTDGFPSYRIAMNLNPKKKRRKPPARTGGNRGLSGLFNVAVTRRGRGDSNDRH